MAEEHGDNTREIAGTIVASYLENNQMPADDVPQFIRKVMAAVQGGPDGGAGEAASRPEPAVPVKKSVAADHVTCLVCGKRMKALKRHLRTEHGMGPEEYRAAFGLPRDHPLVSRNYSKQRADMAKRIGLGQSGGGRKKAAKTGTKRAAKKAG